MFEADKFTIQVARDFSRFPFGRYLSHGPFSGEAFRNNLLKKRLREFSRVRVVLDGALGYSSSFLEEAFGGLVRDMHWSQKDFSEKIEIISNDDPTLVDEIFQYAKDASA